MEEKVAKMLLGFNPNLISSSCGCSLVVKINCYTNEMREYLLTTSSKTLATATNTSTPNTNNTVSTTFLNIPLDVSPLTSLITISEPHLTTLLVYHWDK
ncbi:hypothetical protein Pmani_039433 [Petrolisthes manimaculis]|uniref:Uncharacterized protein n=1 Tax=Petrolisthes manimaculis TaxID=1843537 RepID=A0AAE1NCV1_9EUCA|nr:hypothetical protein Pmani_039433 [Petrolisthes manimaculis]